MAFDAKVRDVCQLYADAPALLEQSQRAVSCDELTGVQASERLHADVKMQPGKVELHEYSTIRHGTATFIVSRDVVTGQVIEPSAVQTRKEQISSRTCKAWLQATQGQHAGIVLSTLSIRNARRA